MYITSTHLAVPHLPNLQVPVHVTAIADLPPMTITRNGVAELLPACACPVMHVPTRYLLAAKTTGGLQTMGFIAGIKGSDALLGIVMTRTSRDLSAAILDLGQLSEIGVVEQALRTGRFPMLLSAGAGMQQMLMPPVNDGIRLLLEKGRHAKAMTPEVFVELSGQAVQDLVQPDCDGRFGLDLATFRPLSVSMCVRTGDNVAGGKEPFASGTLH